MLVPEPRAGAAHARLDLVDHQQPATLIAQSPQLPQIVGTSDADAAFPLNRLDQHRNDAGRLVCRAAHRFDVVVGNPQETRHQRLKALLLRRIAGGRECGQGAAMKAVFHHEDLGLRHLPAVPMQACELECGFVGLGARVAKEDPLHARQRAQTFAQLLLPVDAEHVGGVQQQSGLLGDDGGNLRMGMAQAGDGDTRDGVQVLHVVRIPQTRAAATRE